MFEGYIITNTSHEVTYSQTRLLLFVHFNSICTASANAGCRKTSTPFYSISIGCLLLNLFLSASTFPPAKFSSPVPPPPPICIGLCSNWGHCASLRLPTCPSLLAVRPPAEAVSPKHHPPPNPVLSSWQSRNWTFSAKDSLLATVRLCLSLLQTVTKPNILTVFPSVPVLRSCRRATHRIHGDEKLRQVPLSQCPSLLPSLVLVSLSDDPRPHR